MAAPSRMIDTHQHVFWHGRDDRGLIQDLDEHGIEQAWLLSWEIPSFEDNAGYHGVLNPVHVRADGTHRGIPLEDGALAATRHPGRFVLGYCPHPALGNAPAFLRAAANIHGVKVCGEWKFRMLFDDPRCLELFRTAGELKMPVVLHLDVPYLPGNDGKSVYQPLWYGGTVENLERALKACPETVFVGHAPGFWREISGDADNDPGAYPKGAVRGRGRLFDLFDRYPNLCADLSAGSGCTALRRDPDNAVKFLCRYHDRLLFARDYFGQELHSFLKTLSLPEDVREDIYHRNAGRLVLKT
ncbi:MAG: amidohydrolase family protein [Verrucomicrobiae bacterium]|nr:amidohydrolase family protein [Verrucomicrobiae bacterium]